VPIALDARDLAVIRAAGWQTHDLATVTNILSVCVAEGEASSPPRPQTLLRNPRLRQNTADCGAGTVSDHAGAAMRGTRNTAVGTQSDVASGAYIA
jgi:hypothetical protein